MVIKGLEQIIMGSGFNGLDCLFSCAVSGHHNDLNHWIGIFYFFQYLETIHFRHLYIH